MQNDPRTPPVLQQKFHQAYTRATANINGLKCFEVQHATLVQLGVRWLSRKCSVVLYEAAATKSEIPDVIGWAGVAIAIAEESKGDAVDGSTEWLSA